MGELADLFNLNEDTLRQFLQDTSRRRPHIDTLSNIAGVIGVSVMEFIDSPVHPVPGMSRKKWTELSERERVLVSALYADIADDELSVLEKEGLYEIFTTAKETLLRIRKKR